MNPERWGEIQTLFAEVRGLKPDERSVRLADISETDPELHAELESLLAAHDSADGLLGHFERVISEPSFEPAASDDVDAKTGSAPPTDPHGLIGQTVSDYEVLEDELVRLPSLWSRGFERVVVRIADG